MRRNWLTGKRAAQLGPEPVRRWPVEPERESVWDYPRPPRAERVSRRARIVHAGTLVLDTTDLVRVLETSHPPTYYVPRSEFRVPLRPASRLTMCEWKGEACYVDIAVPGVAPLAAAGWWYPQPDLRYPQLTDRVAVYADRFDEITLDGQPVTPQPGGFYGGWITPEIAGPFKGSPGTQGW
ncbi:MAG TPA: DUF427 domain-containing protein [Pseudonocardiaceae bacterium]|nr:DUF427 domain-containing protein [Pseudonocardiaceae bacterium]